VIKISPDGNKLALGFADGKILIYDNLPGKTIQIC
jgi:WD40 repeat protein